MKITNCDNKKVTLTELESKVYNSLKNSDTMEDCFCDSMEELSDNTKIPMNEIRGVVSSLIKKDIAYIDEIISGCGKWVILY